MSNNQEHRITYKAGITRTPSDFLCQDGELAECINLTTDNEELKPIVQPAEYMNTGGTRIRYIHKYNGQERYIALTPVTPPRGVHINCHVVWGEKENGSFIVKGQLPVYLEDSTVKITSIGKVLIVTSGESVDYFLWKGNTYKAYSDLPTPQLEFQLSDMYHCYASGKYGDILDLSQTLDDKKIKDQEGYNDLLTGLYSKTKKSVSQKKAFCNPFLVRAALEMYNGTYTKITSPVLMFPSVTSNSHVTAITVDGKDHLRVATWGYQLYFTQSVDYTDFNDIVKDVVLFVSEPIDLYDLTIDQEIHPLNNGDVIRDCITRKRDTTLDIYYSMFQEYTNTGLQAGFNALIKKETKDVLNALKSSSVFYKLCEIGLRPSEFTNTAEFIETHTLENLTTMPRLQYDDYYSNTKLYPGFAYSYNSRLNIANVSRSFFEGFHHFLPYDNPHTSTYYFYVKIDTDIKNVWIKHTKVTNQKQGLYFFYPDPRAKHVTIYKKEETQQDVYTFTCVLDAELTEHKGLNGAYYLGSLPPDNYTEPSVTVSSAGYSISSSQVDDDTADNYDTEILPNYIITSDVDNPFVFLKEGYNKVGTGKILAMSTTTMALSQDQYGKTPLIVFSENGTWGMHVDKTGLFEGIDPFTRDVIINPDNIIQTDGAVFFVSKRGLMVISNVDNRDRGVQCVSERLNGTPFNTATLTGIATGTDWASIVSTCQSSLSFLDYIRSANCNMAYDFLSQNVLITNSDYNYSYMFNIAEGTISKVVLPNTVIYVLNDYPDYLIQMGNKLYSLYGKPNEDAVNSRSLGFLLTRPMKLAGPVSKASLRQLKNVGFWDEGTQQTPLSCVKIKIYLSDDMKNWHEDTSRFGAAAKYYRLALFIKMLPSERLSGTILEAQPRRTNNMR